MLIREMKAMHSGHLMWQLLHAPHPYPIGTHVPIGTNDLPLQMSVALSKGSLWTQKLFVWFFPFASVSFILSQNANILLKTWNLNYG